MSRIVESFEEKVVVAPQKRYVHVVEDVTAHVEAWHGGRRIDTLGGWTTVGAAIADARRKAELFGVDRHSTLSIVVREELRQSRVVGDKVDLDRRGEKIQREVVVGQNYAYDAVHGALSKVGHRIGFVWAMPVQFAKATDWPGESLKDYFRPLTVRGWRDEFLYGGYGYRNFHVDRTTTRPARPDEVPPDAERKRSDLGGSECWMVVFEGELTVFAPADRGIDRILADLGAEEMDLDVFIEWGKDRDRINRERWAMWTGAPATKPMLWRTIGGDPVAAEGAGA